MVGVATSRRNTARERRLPLLRQKTMDNGLNEYVTSFYHNNLVYEIDYVPNSQKHTYRIFLDNEFIIGFRIKEIKPKEYLIKKAKTKL